MTAARRRRAWAFGGLAENLCAWHLRFRGYRILARRFRTPVGELDIVARRGSTLAVVEVKARADAITARDSLSSRQQGRIIRAAEAFITARPAWTSASTSWWWRPGGRRPTSWTPGDHKFALAF